MSYCYLSYTVDRRNNIVRVCDNWRKFAMENDAPELVPEKVLGTSLLRYISDATSRHLYDRLLRRVRQSGAPVQLEIHCDSPDKRRELRLTMTGLDDGSVEFTSLTILEESRPLYVTLLDRKLHHTEPGMTMCSWCNRILAGEQWLEIEFALPQMGVLAAPVPPTISHGICPDCLAKVTRAAGGDD